MEATACRCMGGHRHVHLMSGRAKAAAIYPTELCDALVKGYCFWRKNVVEGPGPRVLMDFARADLCDPEEIKLEEAQGQYIDDLKGDVLDPGLARKARAEELEVFQERQVYDTVERSRVPRGAKVVGVRWVETNKGTASAPKVLSRLVCQEFNFGGDTSGDMFAPTPPLGATRFLLSGVASRSRSGPGVYRAMLLDFKRAFLYGDCERELYIELPSEDLRRQDGNCVGRLRKRQCMGHATPRLCGKDWFRKL